MVKSGSVSNHSGASDQAPENGGDGSRRSESLSSGMSGGPPDADAVSFEPIVWVGAVFLAQAYLFYDNTLFLFVLPIALFSPILTLIFLYVGIQRVARKRYRSAFSPILSVFLLILVSGIPFVSGGFARDTGRYFKFALNSAEYLKEVKLQPPDEKGLRFKEFSWGTFMMKPVTLVYDDSDEVASPKEKRSAYWLEKRSDSSFVQCQYEVKEMGTHFYVVDFGC